MMTMTMMTIQVEDLLEFVIVALFWAVSVVHISVGENNENGNEIATVDITVNEMNSQFCVTKVSI
jgi:hypothetical protein